MSTQRYAPEFMGKRPPNCGSRLFSRGNFDKAQRFQPQPLPAGKGRDGTVPHSRPDSFEDKMGRLTRALSTEDTPPRAVEILVYRRLSGFRSCTPKLALIGAPIPNAS
jgi:hypothetical protein